MTYSNDELHEAERAIASLLSKCEKVLPKLTEKISQHTLLVRRIEALRISLDLIKQQLTDPPI